MQCGNNHLLEVLHTKTVTCLTPTFHLTPFTMSKKRGRRSNSNWETKRKKKKAKANANAKEKKKEEGDGEESNPYEEFKKDLVKLLKVSGHYYWDDENFCLVPESFLKKKLPVAECDLSLGYYPGLFAYLKPGESNDSPRLQLLLHAWFEVGKKLDGVHVDMRGFSLPQDILQKLKQYSPKVNSQYGYLYYGKTEKLAKSEMLKHLPSIPFLTRDTYWSSAIAAYEKYQMGSFIDFIMDEGEKRHLLVDADPLTHPGWSILRFSSFVRLAHLYPPIKSSGGQLSFRVFRSITGYYLKEILLSLTRHLEPAARSRSLVIYEDLLAPVHARYVPVVPFDAPLLFKKKINE